VSVVIGSVAGLKFISLVPVIVFSSIIPRDQPIPSRPGIDKLGLALQGGAMIAIVLGILLIGDYGLLIAKKPLVIAGVDVISLELGLLGLSPVVLLEGLGIVLLILFVKVERRNARNQQPSLDRLTLFGIADFVNGLEVRSIEISVLAGILFSAPLFTQVSFGISAFHSPTCRASARSRGAPSCRSEHPPSGGRPASIAVSPHHRRSRRHL